MVREGIRNGRHERGSAYGLAGIADHKLVLVVLVEGIDVGAGKFASRDPHGEENVELVKSAVFGLRQTEICLDNHHPCAAIGRSVK